MVQKIPPRLPTPKTMDQPFSVILLDSFPIMNVLYSACVFCILTRSATQSGGLASQPGEHSETDNVSRTKTLKRLSQITEKNYSAMKTTFLDNYVINISKIPCYIFDK